MREPRYYWVKGKRDRDQFWTIGELYDEGDWALLGTEETFEDDELIIGPRVPPPEEKQG